MATDALDAAARSLNKIHALGPKGFKKKKPGEISASGWKFWEDFFADHSKGDDTHKLEKDMEDAPSPERIGATKAAHALTNSALQNKYNQLGQDSTPGGQMVRDVVRKEMLNRGMTPR